jgi:hypothetical protein
VLVHQDKLRRADNMLTSCAEGLVDQRSIKASKSSIQGPGSRVPNVVQFHGPVPVSKYPVPVPDPCPDRERLENGNREKKKGLKRSDPVSMVVDLCNANGSQGLQNPPETD